MARLGYILKDGSFFDVKAAGFKNHWQYEQSLVKSKELDSLEDIYKRQVVNKNGWIRVNDGSNLKFENSVELPIAGITDEQYKELLNFLDYMWFNNKKFVDVGIEENSKGPKFSNNAIFLRHYEFSDYTSDDIIKEIKYYYNNIRGL